jgi:hypothetical protein
MKRSEADLAKLKDVLENGASTTLCVHCSRQNLADNEGGVKTPRIIAIMVKSLDGRVVRVFAIHHEAEKAKIIEEEIEDFYDELEGRLLVAFNRFVEAYRDFAWLHWDMDGVHFGFTALRHRYEVLVNNTGDGYCEIPEDKTLNLNSLLRSIYGERYESEPQLENLMKTNNGGSAFANYLSLHDEALAFRNRTFPRILESVACKVDFMLLVVRRASSKTLDVRNKNFLYRMGLFFSHPVMIAIAWVCGVVGLLWSLLFC